MTVRPRASVIPVLLALTALALTACSSQGTVGENAAGGLLPGAATTTAANPSATSATSAASAATGAPSTQDDPSALASSLKTLNRLWTDQGCKIALAGFGDYLSAAQKSEQAGIAAIPGAVKKIQTGAQQTKKPGAATEMNKMVRDMQAMATEAQHGQKPDKGPLKTDFQIMGTICSRGNG